MLIVSLLAAFHGAGACLAHDAIQGWNDIKLGMTRKEVEAADPSVREIGRLEYLSYAEVLGTDCLPDPADRSRFEALGLPKRTELACNVLMLLGTSNQLQYRALLFFARDDTRLDTIQVATDLMRPEMPARVIYAELIRAAVGDLGPPSAQASGRVRNRAGRWFASATQYCAFLSQKRAEGQSLTEQDFSAPRVEWGLWRQTHAELAIRIYDTYWRMSPDCPRPQEQLDSDELRTLGLPFAMIQIQVQRRRGESNPDEGAAPSERNIPLERLDRQPQPIPAESCRLAWRPDAAVWI